MDTTKDYVAVHLRLIYINLFQVLMLLLIYPVDYVFQTSQKI